MNIHSSLQNTYTGSLIYRITAIEVVNVMCKSVKLHLLVNLVHQNTLHLRGEWQIGATLKDVKDIGMVVPIISSCISLSPEKLGHGERRCTDANLTK